MNRTIYFDNGSTSWPKAPGVAGAMAELLENGAFNINRGNYAGAYEVESIVLDTREQLARLFGGEDSRYVIFTPGITYSLNFFIKGFLKQGDHVLVSGLEHNAVMRPLEQMKRSGVSYDIVPVDEEGNLDAGRFDAMVKPETKAVIVTHASNVCGTVIPIREIGEICRRKNLFFAVDTAQSAGTILVDMKECGVDFLAFTGHKGLLGPQGIGGFLISEQLNEQMESYIAGGTGSQSDLLIQPSNLPDKYESGTMNIPGIVGLHAALDFLEKTGIDVIHEKKMGLTKYFLEKMEGIPGIRIVGRKDVKNRVAVVALDFRTVDNAVAAFELEQEYGIMTRVGLHCAPVAHQSLHTFPQGAVRFAFGLSNTMEEIDCCVEGIRKLAACI